VTLPITVHVPTPLLKFTAGTGALKVAARNLRELFDGLEQQFPGIKRALSKDDGNPHHFLNIYVNDEDIRFLGGVQYTFQDGDEVLFVPAIAGGT
jgi:molybdopterin converting factor small subunit